MLNEALLESLIQGIYKAAVNGAGWLTFLCSFGGALDSSHPSLYLADTSGREGSIEISVGMDDTHRRAYREYYVHRNLWIRGARPLLRPGSIRSSDQVCSRPELLRSEWYTDFCRPLGWARGIGATVVQDGTVTANIGAFRGAGQPQYADEEFALLRELMPHLQRGFKMHQSLCRSRAHGLALEAVLDGLSTPVLLVTKDGTVHFMNSAAERLIRTSDGLLVTDGKLRALRPAETAALCLLLGEAAQTSAGEGRKAGGSLQVSRSCAREPLELLVSPLPCRQHDWLVNQPPAAAIFVTDPSGSAEDSALARQHRLTAREVRVALAVARGLAGKEICRELDISYNTLKTHLKHIYAKTGAKHQSHLVRLLAMEPRLTAVQEESLGA